MVNLGSQVDGYLLAQLLQVAPRTDAWGLGVHEGELYASPSLLREVGRGDLVEG